MKWKCLLCLILSALLLSSCSFVTEEPTAPTQTMCPHSLDSYTKWIGHPVQDSLDALIKRQSADGAWHLTWRFGTDERFRPMEKRYEAHYTMLVLNRLAAFGRLEDLR